MIITINGEHGSGKSTVAKKVAEELDFEYYYTGQIFRDMARKRGVTLVELLELAETDKSIDREVDEKTMELGKHQDNFIFDSRMAWHFIPDSLKIFLKVSEEESARRILKHIQEQSSDRANESESMNTMEEIMKTNRRRKETDAKRYWNYYGVDAWSEDNYDLVIDTTSLTRQEVLEKVLNFIKNHK
jgi:cytidylate kinase